MQELLEVNKVKLSGEIKTKTDNVFDYEQLKQVILQIQARDTLKTKFNDTLHSIFTTVTIDVQDINDEPPTITLVRVIKKLYLYIYRRLSC